MADTAKDIERFKEGFFESGIGVVETHGMVPPIRWIQLPSRVPLLCFRRDYERCSLLGSGITNLHSDPVIDLMVDPSNCLLAQLYGLRKVVFRDQLLD